MHSQEFQQLVGYLPALWGNLGLSLRDIDYCVRLISLIGKNLKPRHYIHPPLVGLLIALKLKNPALYRQFIQGDCLGSDVMNYIDRETLPQGLSSNLAGALDVIEAYLYLTDKRDALPVPGTSTALNQLDLLDSGSALTHPEYLSDRTKKASPARAGQMIATIKAIQNGKWPSGFTNRTTSYVAEMIDLHQHLITR